MRRWAAAAAVALGATPVLATGALAAPLGAHTAAAAPEQELVSVNTAASGAARAIDVDYAPGAVWLSYDEGPLESVRGGVWLTYADGRVELVSLSNDAVPTVLGRRDVVTSGWMAPGETAVEFLIAPTGWWVVTSLGRVFATGGATHHGDLAGLALNEPVVDAAATPSGNGYLMLAADGGVFTFGDARFHGSVQGVVDEWLGPGHLAADHLSAPIVTVGTTPHGYWLVGADGAVYSFGYAPYLGSFQDIINTNNQLADLEGSWWLPPRVAPGKPMARDVLDAPIISFVPSGNSDGYLMLGADGGIFTYGNARFLGSFAHRGLPAAVAIDVAADGSSYVTLTADGNVHFVGERGVHHPCRPTGPEGFPLPSGATHADVSDGTFDVLAVFAEFGDARHNEHQLPWSESLALLAMVERYIEAQSYGNLDVRFSVIPQWVTIADSHRPFLTDNPVLGPNSLEISEITWRAAVAAKRFGDVTRGGARFDSILVVTPPEHFDAGLASEGDLPTDDAPTRTTTDDGRLFLQPTGEPTIRTAALSGARLVREPVQQPEFSVTTTAHELLHNLGLNDLYAYDETGRFEPDERAQLSFVKPEFGLMGLSGYRRERTNREFWYDRWIGTAFPASGRPVHDADVAASVRPNAQEALGWSRWRLGWLDESDVTCIEPGASTVELGPLAAPGAASALAVVPASGRQLLVLEARRRIGYDADTLDSYVNGGTFWDRHLPEEGVLAYLVDPTLRSGQVAIKLLGDDGTGLLSGSPILTEGESLWFGESADSPAIEVEVTRDDGTIFAVDVSWRAS